MKRAIVSVSLDGHEIFRLEGEKSKTNIVAFEDRYQVVAALGMAVNLFISAQPLLSDLAQAADCLSNLMIGEDPKVEAAAKMRVLDTITDLSDALLLGPDVRSIQ